jgi:hypothetical protein
MNNLAEFRHFRYLLAIVEHKGFRAAAEHLRTAEPNLSVQSKTVSGGLCYRALRPRRSFPCHSDAL